MKAVFYHKQYYNMLKMHYILNNKIIIFVEILFVFL